jgi:L-alanine-DL-glutamate epimerase-like enolase superfamily enzyme
MRIVKAETLLLAIPFDSGGGLAPWGWGGAPANTFDVLLVRLETEDGIVGWGEAFSRMEDHALKRMIDDRILPLVFGRDAREIARIKHDLEFNLHNFGRVGPLMYGISAVDIALWDIAGKACGRPLVDLLGGAHAERVEVYASLVRYGSAERVAAAVRRAIGQGYRWIKLHEIALPVIAAAVEAAGTGARVMLDVNCPWSVEEALAHDQALAPLGLHWLEEPVWPPENALGLARIRAAGHHRIASGENAGSLYDFVALHEAAAIDIDQPDVAKSGGITELRKIAHYCAANNLTFSPHCGLFGPGQIATLHLTTAEPHPPLFERLYLDFEAELFGDAAVVVDGGLPVPTRPGLGVDPDPAVIAHYRKARRVRSGSNKGLARQGLRQVDQARSVCPRLPVDLLAGEDIEPAGQRMVVGEQDQIFASPASARNQKAIIAEKGHGGPDFLSTLVSDLAIALHVDVQSFEVGQQQPQPAFG